MRYASLIAVSLYVGEDALRSKAHVTSHKILEYTLQSQRAAEERSTAHPSEPVHLGSVAAHRDPVQRHVAALPPARFLLGLQDRRIDARGPADVMVPSTVERSTVSVIWTA